MSLEHLLMVEILSTTISSAVELGNR